MMNARLKELSEQAAKESNFDGYNVFYNEKLIELIVKECANAADMAYDARCKHPGDYVGEQLGYGAEEGISNWRAK